MPFDKTKMHWRRKKKSTDFEIPLSRQAVELIRELREITGDSEWLFPGRKGKPVHKGIMNRSLVLMGYGGAGKKGAHQGHGFRKSFRTIMERQKGPDGRRLYEAAAIGLCLDHRPGGIDAIYNKDRAMEDRTAIMQHWADLCDTMRRGGNSRRKVELKVVA
jgi:integrase